MMMRTVSLRIINLSFARVADLDMRSRLTEKHVDWCRHVRNSPPEVVLSVFNASKVTNCSQEIVWLSLSIAFR